MNFDQLAYDMCRHYVTDCRGQISKGQIDTILGWIRSRSLEKLATCSEQFPDTEYHCLEKVRFERQVEAFFKKNSSFSNADVCEEAAEKAFRKGELLCKLTNKRLDHYLTNENRLPPALALDITRVREIIFDVLGDFDEFLANLPMFVRFTAGATATRSRRNALPYLKVGKRHISCTDPARPYISALAKFFGYGRVTFRRTENNRVVTVPKNYKTNRTIACEPEGNLILQLAFDTYIKRCLLKIGIDLSKQSRNQELARLGSINDDLVTVDLSMASDTLSYNTVFFFFFFKWAKFLSYVRSPCGVGFGDTVKYEKFSSMGNGSTFGIETLIFGAISKVASPDLFSVYGDDIIIRSTGYDRLSTLLNFFGFKLNTQKSFLTGPFRESCGADWYEGTDITPFYMRVQNPEKLELCHIINGLSSVSTFHGNLWHFMHGLIRDHDLPLVPFNGSSISGVWVTPYYVYAKKLLSWTHKGRKTFIPRYKAFIPKARTRNVFNSRTLFLWHLDAYRGGKEILNQTQEERKEQADSVTSRPLSSRVSDPNFLGEIKDATIRTSVPTLTHGYKRKWVCWHMPSTGTPDHLFWWSDFITRSDAGSKGMD